MPDRILQTLVDAGGVPGVAIGVMAKGQVVYQKGFGLADIDKAQAVDPLSSLFRIASVSKPIAATALAKMVAEGSMDLDVPYHHYVPEYPRKKWPFTIRQLAGHTAGIRSYKGKEFALNKAISIPESITVFKEDPLLFEPGTAYHYTSYGWVLIALAMERVSGMPFADYVESRLLTPCGMRHTLAPAGVHLSSGVTETKHYTKRSRGFREALPVDNNYKLAGGGYLSTVNDLLTFGQYILTGGAIAASVMDDFLSAQRVNGTATYYGLGWQVSQDAKGRRFYGHVGSAVGAYSNFFIYPEAEVVFVALINCTDPKVQEALDEVLAFFLSPEV